jgi:hypothetical protein
MADKQITPETGVEFDQDEGTIQNSVIVNADFLPDRDRNWPIRHVASRGIGFKVVMGQLAGIATSAERRVSEWQGKELMSIWLHGNFTATIRATGELIEASSVIPPQAYAAKVERMLGLGVGKVEVDIDVGLQATGRNIPYRWFASDYSESEEREAARAIQHRQAARSAKLIGSSNGGPKTIAGKVEPEKDDLEEMFTRPAKKIRSVE